MKNNEISIQEFKNLNKDSTEGKVKGKRSNREYQISKAVTSYLLQHPKKPLFHWDLSGQFNSSIAQRTMMARIQHIKGFPDLMVFTKNGLILLEIKKEGTKLFKKDGKTYTTPHIAEQAMMHKALRGMVLYVDFVIGLDECIRIIDIWLK